MWIAAVSGARAAEAADPRADAGTDARADAPSVAIPAPVAAALAAANVPAAHAAVFVAPVAEGPLRVSVRAQVPMNPASTMKLVTTYVAMQALGPAYHWHTDALAAMPVREGTLDGPLWLRGGGDPSLVIERFWLLVQQLRAAGLRTIRGDLVVDKSAYDPSVANGSGTLDGNELRPYNVHPDALLVNYKAITLSFAPDADARVAAVVAMPPLAGFRAPASVRLADGGCGDWQSRLQGDFRDPWAPAFGGAYPAACGEQAWNLSLLPATDYAGAAFRALWESSGGSWEGRVREGTVPPGARTLAVLDSPPLAEVIREINKWSNNVMARQVFLTIGAEASHLPASTELAARAVRSWLERNELAMPELQLENGSGLSRSERISAGSLGRLLLHAWRSPMMPELVASLPLSGVDGTMRKRPAAAGAAHVKTGYLADARAVAGYVQAASGKTYVVVSFINDPNAPAAQAAHDALLQWVRDRG